MNSNYLELAERLENNGCDCPCREAVELEAAAALREADARIAELEADNERLRAALRESCEDNRQQYCKSFDCARPCPIGYRIAELEAALEEVDDDD